MVVFIVTNIIAQACKLLHMKPKHNIFITNYLFDYIETPSDHMAWRVLH